MKVCIVCDQSTPTPWRSAFSHFYLYQSGQWKWLRGNIRMFGFRQGLLATLCLAFPFFNTLWHWKYRKHQLKVGR